MRLIRHSIDLGPLLAKAVNSHQAGDLESAQAIYAEILADAPNHFDALHLLGVLRHQQGRNEEARALILAAIAVNPKSVDALCNLGLVLQEQRRYAEAVAVYDRALAVDPRLPEALNNRGTALRGLNRPAAAIMSFDRALAIRPDYTEAHLNRAALLAGLGRSDEAIAGYDQMIAARPENFEAHRGRGRALQAQQKFEAALLSYARAMILRPEDVDIRHDRGVALNALGRHREAIGELDKVLAKQPDNGAALAQRGIALAEVGRYPEAEVALARAISLRPDDAAALDSRGVALQGLDRPTEALACHDRAMAIKPANPAALNNRGHALLALKRYAEALESYDRALAFAPAGARVLVNRGVALGALRQHQEALECFNAALLLMPNDASPHCHRGDALMALGNFAAAFESYERMLVLRMPLTAALDRLALCVAKLCDWPRAAEIAHQLEIHVRDGTAVISPLTLLHYDSTLAQQLACARRYIRDRVPPVSAPLIAATARNHDKLRIAYLSANFNRPALTSLVADLFERHDRSKFEITGISFGADEDAIARTRTVSAFDAFFDLRASSDRDIAQRLRDLEIDIAIDLMGHRDDARPGILAARPVPIQVAYLGHAGTMGADFIDYIIADSIVVPPGEETFYAEKVVRLPDCYQVNDAKRVIAENTPTRKQAGLPEKGFVFASFNGGNISASVFDVWMGLLARIDGSVLWLSEVSDGTKFNLHQHAAARGADPARLIFAPPVDEAEHLARHRLADLFLDTFPCSTQTAASDALWAGLPVLTCRGNTFAGRVAASQLQSLGLTELVTSSPADYTALAQWLAEDRDILAEIRKRLAENRSTRPLFDTDLTRHHLEEAYTIMWARRQAGGRPASFEVEARPEPPPPPRPAPPPPAPPPAAPETAPAPPDAAAPATADAVTAPPAEAVAPATPPDAAAAPPDAEATTAEAPPPPVVPS
jgi:protein O-GlcNAc transferase